MSIIRILAAPLIGAAIGYVTNYIAVKMLFRPRNQIKIGKFVLPFTPGMIPKRKPELASAIGSVVESTLINGEAITEILLSQDMKQVIAKQIQEGIGEHEVEVAGRNLLSDHYDSAKEKTVDLLTEKIVNGLQQLDMGKIIAEEGGTALKEMASGSMLAMFLNDDLIAQFAQPLGNKVNDYIKDNGKTKIQPFIEQEFCELEQSDVNTLLQNMGQDKESISQVLVNGYEKIITQHAGKIKEVFHIQKIVEDKINEMSVEQLEELVMSVMKKELGAIVNLGALIGFVLGLLNILFF